MASKYWMEKADQLGSETYILSLVTLNGNIYGSTAPNAKLYRWNGSNAWNLVADKPDTQTYMYALAVYNGEIYGGSGPNARLYKFSSNQWVQVAERYGSQNYIYSLAVYNGELYGGTMPNGMLLKFTGSAWALAAPQFDGETYIRSLAVFNGKLYGSTYPSGRLYEYDATSGAWVQKAAKYGQESYVRSLTVFNGKLYGGSGPNGRLLEWNGVDSWILKAPKLGTSIYIYSMIELNGELLAGTYNNGNLQKWNGTDAWVQLAEQLGSETFIHSLCLLNDKIYGGTATLGKLYKYKDETMNRKPMTLVNGKPQLLQPDDTLLTSKLTPSADGTTAIQITKTDGTTVVMNVDTTNSRVGIGTTAPSLPLHIKDTVTSVLKLESSDTVGSGLQLDATATGGRQFAIYSTANGAGQGGGKLIFMDEDSSATRIIMDSSGNVGIGASTPLDVLHVQGGIRSSGAALDYNSGDQLTLEYNSGNARINVRNTGATGNFSLLTQGSERLKVNADGQSKITKETTNTNSLSTILIIQQKTTNDMSEGFASALYFTGTDSGASDKVFGIVAGVRGSADTEGKLDFYAGTDGVEKFMTILQDGGVVMTSIKSGATQVAAGAAAGELWKTASHATLPDNVVMIGV